MKPGNHPVKPVPAPEQPGALARSWRTGRSWSSSEPAGWRLESGEGSACEPCAASDPSEFPETRFDVKKI